MKLASYRHLWVPNFSVHALCEVLKGEGLDWHRALHAAEIDQAAVDRLGGTIPAAKELAFQLQFVALTQGRVDLWLRATEAYMIGAFGITGLALITAPTMSAFVKACAADDAPALAKISPLHAVDGGVVGIQTTYDDAPDELVEFSSYRDFYSSIRLHRMLYGRPFPYTRVELPVSPVAPEAASLVDCEVEGGSDAVRFWWDPDSSHLPFPFGNAFQHATWLRREHQVLEELRAVGDWPDTVTRLIRQSPTTNGRLEIIAAELCVSPRTLRRNLAASGRNFTRLRDDVLNEMASDLLATTRHPVSRIAQMLGYADTAGFSIAFKRWNGIPPSAYRNGYRSSAS